MIFCNLVCGNRRPLDLHRSVKRPLPFNFVGERVRGTGMEREWGTGMERGLEYEWNVDGNMQGTRRGTQQHIPKCRSGRGRPASLGGPERPLSFRQSSHQRTTMKNSIAKSPHHVFPLIPANLTSSSRFGLDRIIVGTVDTPALSYSRLN